MTRRPRRRDLARLLAGSGTVLLGTTACGLGPSPVATSTDIARDPLAEVDPAGWDARSAEEMLAQPIDGDPSDYEPWAGIEVAEGTLDGARQQLVDFIDIAYLSPERLRGMDDDAAREAVLAATPEYWTDSVTSNWDDGRRYFSAIAFAEPVRTVGRPLITADWYLGQDESDPALMVAGSIGWSVIDTETRDVGVVAYRYGANVRLDDDASIIDGLFRVTHHGIDACATEEAGGLIVPTLGDAPDYPGTQAETMNEVIGAPRISREQIEDDYSAILDGHAGTNVYCD